MSDKKDYIRVLKALDRAGTLDAALNLLSEVRMETEDAALRNALGEVCDLARLQAKRYQGM